MSKLKSGDVVLVNFPFTDLNATKLRPAVIISKDMVHDKCEDYTLLFISSVIPIEIEAFEYLIETTHPDFKQTGLKCNSFVKGNKIVTLHSTLIKRRLGYLTKNLKINVNRIIHEAIGFN